MYKKKQEYLDTIWEEERMPEYFHFDDYRVNLEDIPLVTTGDVISSINSSREDGSVKWFMKTLSIRKWLK